MSVTARIPARSASGRRFIVGLIIVAISSGAPSFAMDPPALTVRAATARRDNAADLLVAVIAGLTDQQNVRSAYSRRLVLDLGTTIDGWAESDPELAERLDEPIATAFEALGFLDEASHHLARAIARDRELRRQGVEQIAAGATIGHITRGIAMARLWGQTGRAEDAVELLQELTPILDGMRARTASQYRPRVDRALGESLIGAGRPAEAVEPLRRARAESTARSASAQSSDTRLLARALIADGAGAEAVVVLGETISGLRERGALENSTGLATLRVAEVSALRAAGRPRDAMAQQRRVEESLRFEERFGGLRSPEPEGWGELLVADGRLLEAERWLWRGIHALSMRGTRVPIGELRRRVADVIDVAERRGDEAAAESARQWLIRFEQRFRSAMADADDPDSDFDVGVGGEAGVDGEANVDPDLADE